MTEIPAEITLVLQIVNVAYVKVEGQTPHTLDGQQVRSMVSFLLTSACRYTSV